MDGIRRTMGGIQNGTRPAQRLPELLNTSKVPPEIWAEIVKFVPTKDLGRLATCNIALRSSVFDELRSPRRREQFLEAHMKENFYGPKEWQELFPEYRITGFPACNFELTPYLMKCILEKTHIIVGIPEQMNEYPLNLRRIRNELFEDIRFMNKRDPDLWYPKEWFDRKLIQSGYYLVPNFSIHPKDEKNYLDMGYEIAPTDIMVLTFCLYQKKMGLAIRGSRDLICCKPEKLKDNQSHRIIVSIARKYGINIEKYKEQNGCSIGMETAFMKRL